MTATIWVVRHGATEWSRSGRHTGHTDLPLLPEGRDEAVAAGHRVRAAVTPPALVLTSPLARAAETCRLAGFGEVAEPTVDLSEWDYGDFEGLTTEEIRERVPGWTLWSDGVPGGETAAQVGLRADRVIARAEAAAGDVVCFSHGHLLRVLASRWVGLPPAAGRLLALGAGTVGALGREREARVISLWNEVPRGAGRA